jgi:hypothetical protein
VKKWIGVEWFSQTIEQLVSVTRQILKGIFFLRAQSVLLGMRDIAQRSTLISCPEFHIPGRTEYGTEVVRFKQSLTFRFGSCFCRKKKRVYNSNRELYAV